MVAKSCVGDCVRDYCGSNLEASKEYRFVKDFFMEKMEGDLLYKEVQQVMHTARGSMCAGWLMGYLTETEDALEIREGMQGAIGSGCQARFADACLSDAAGTQRRPHGCGSSQAVGG